MSMLPESPMANLFRQELEALRCQWGWMLALGIALVVLGTVAIGVPALVTLTTVVFFGVLLLLAGVTEAIGAFWARDWSGFFSMLLGGLFYLILGFLFVASPGESALAVTIIIAAFLIVGGVFRIILAWRLRFAQWGWLAFSGVVTVLLGFLIWAKWPFSGFWVIGLFVGIEMLMNGWWLIMIALGLRQLPRRQESGHATA